MIKEGCGEVGGAEKGVREEEGSHPRVDRMGGGSALWLSNNRKH